MELNRVETTLVALACGPCREWSENHLMAHGFAGRRNPLGFALDHLLSNPNGTNARLVTLLLASELIRQKVCTSRESWDAADDAMAWWYDCHCPDCKGRGGIGTHQKDICPSCLGSGRREKPKSRAVNQAIGLIESSIEAMEIALRKRLTGSV